MMEKLNYRLSPDARAALAEYVDLRIEQPQFSNARSIRNAIDRARLRQATRLFERGGSVTTTDLLTIDEADIRQSRVFAQGETEN
jgi:hypothetical protein